MNIPVIEIKVMYALLSNSLFIMSKTCMPATVADDWNVVLTYMVMNLLTILRIELPSPSRFLFCC